jgi:tetratricopeptide (TPR) repeat protein
MRPLLVLWLLLTCSAVRAQQIDLEKIFEEKNLGPVGELLARGDYELVARIGEAAAEKGLKSPDWRILRLKALVEMGQIETALDETAKSLVLFPGHFEILMLRHDFATMLGRTDVAAEALKGLNDAAKAKPAKDRTAMESVMLGRAAIVLGADAQKVISQYFKVAQGKDAKLETAYLAEGHLALDKDDARRAADVFRAGLKAHGETAELRFGLAKAFQSSDREKAVENLTKALELNPHHKAAHLLRAELLIGGEKFVEAEAAVQQVLDFDEQHPAGVVAAGRGGVLVPCGCKKDGGGEDGGVETLEQKPGGGPHPRALPLAGLSLRGECGASAQGAGVRSEISAGQSSALPRSAASRRGRRRHGNWPRRSARRTATTSRRTTWGCWRRRWAAMSRNRSRTSP